MSLGVHLRSMRKKQWKVSLDDMALRCDCSKSYLWDIEHDNCMPSLLMASRIAKAYRTTLARMAKEIGA